MNPPSMEFARYSEGLLDLLRARECAEFQSLVGRDRRRDWLARRVAATGTGA